MKINRNRELLRDFFISASNLLSDPSGSIIISLCSGQGADFFGKRTWTDSWQVVDMAGHANLLLVECSPFQWSSYPLYSNVGYRSLEKGFHTEDAMVHTFIVVKKSLGCHLENVISFYQNGTTVPVVSRPLFARKLKQNILENKSSPAYFVLENLQKYAKLQSSSTVHHIDANPLTESQRKREIALAFQLWKDSKCEFFFYSCYMLNNFLEDFSKSPVTIRTFWFGKGAESMFLTTLNNLLALVNLSNCQINVKDCCSDTDKSKQFYLLESDKAKALIAELFSPTCCDSEAVLSIHVDALVSKLFSLNCWRQMWADCVHMDLNSKNPSVTGICPHPVSYTFDVSFIIGKNFTEQKLFCVLWDLAGEFLINVVKVSEFTTSNETSMCFRLSYLSYDYPMCRKSVLHFHQNILGKALQTILSVSIK